MLAELRDGHVNLFASFDYSRYWGFHENYPKNYSDSLVRAYLGTDYRISNGMRYRVLDDNTGYLRVSTFENTFGSGNLDDMLLYFQPCLGLIIDLRDNGGGMLTSAESLAARFTDKETLVAICATRREKATTTSPAWRSRRSSPPRAYAGTSPWW